MTYVGEGGSLEDAASVLEDVEELGLLGEEVLVAEVIWVAVADHDDINMFRLDPLARQS